MHSRLDSRKSEEMTRSHLPSRSNVIERVLSKTNEMAVLPHVVHKVIELTSVTDSASRELESTIRIDPGFSSRVLRLANSAAFGLPRRVTTVHEAIMFLGHRTIRSVALTVGLFDAFVGKTDRDSIRRREWWRHSVDTAICCRNLAQGNPQIGVEEAYTSGLLHLIGKMLLDRYGGENYGLVQKMIENGAEDYLAEMEIYGCDHCELGVEAARSWDLPLSLLYLRAPEPTDPFARLRACTLVGSRMALRAKSGEKVDSMTCPRWSLDQLSLLGTTMKELGAIGRRAITEAELRI